MDSFELRGKRVHVESATLFESIDYGAVALGQLEDVDLILQAIIYTKRRADSTTQEPWAYTNPDGDLREGIWLNEAIYSTSET